MDPEEILQRHITEQQWEFYNDPGRLYIPVIGSRGTPFHVNRGGYVGNIYIMSPSRPNTWIANYCAHVDEGPYSTLPKALHHLSQVLALQSDEWKFIRVACFLSGTPIKYNHFDGKVIDPYGSGNQERVDPQNEVQHTRNWQIAEYVRIQSGPIHYRYG